MPCFCNVKVRLFTVAAMPMAMPEVGTTFETFDFT
jgi:hypothetical protein